LPLRQAADGIFPIISMSISKKVLIIEDNLDIRENIVEILELSGYKVYAADNGEMGIAMALQYLPDIILCDIMMPELDGYGVLSQLNYQTQMIAIPFIFLTAKSEPMDLRRGIELGANGYLVKPFDAKDLLNTIESKLK
jgi:DNA-binding response OmpR family regulator